jgi:hypothetical protein
MVLVFVVAVMLGACGNDSKSSSSTTFVIQNSSGENIIDVYVVPASASDWGADLCTTTIASGATWTAGEFPSGTYKIQVLGVDPGSPQTWTTPFAEPVLVWQVGNFIH